MRSFPKRIISLFMAVFMRPAVVLAVVEMDSLQPFKTDHIIKMLQHTVKVACVRGQHPFCRGAEVAAHDADEEFRYGLVADLKACQPGGRLVEVVVPRVDALFSVVATLQTEGELSISRCCKHHSDNN